MSLVLKEGAYVGNACRTIYFSDETGVYSTSNTGGWGSPNITTDSITETHIIITLPDGTTVIDIQDPVGLPTDDTTFKYEIPASTVNGGTYIADGLYTMEYTVTDGEDTYTTGAQYFLFTCNTECCVAKLFAKVATDTDCTCNSTTVKNALYADALLQGLLANKDCGSISSINGLLTKLNTICNSSTVDCGCGN